VPRNHTGLGTLSVPGCPDSKVFLDIAPDDTGGWQTVRGTISGDPAALASAFANNQEAELVHDASGFHMHLTVIDVTKDGFAYVTVNASHHLPD
jgi:hypothetical protein